MLGQEWAVVVPVKHLAQAKTRLRAGGAAGGAVGDHRRLVLAMAQDTVAAVRACRVVGRVFVVTDDLVVAAELAEHDATFVQDTPAGGLNAAVRHGAALAAAIPQGWVAALAADLPALRPGDLAEALDAIRVAGARGFVRDADGAGTTLLAAPPGVALAPHFGPDSAARHALSGARELRGDWPSLRQDVDTPADLEAASQLGLGPHTAAQLAARVR